jgi:prophage DNA circulation protein
MHLAEGPSPMVSHHEYIMRSAHAGTLDENGNHQMKSKREAMFIPACPMTQEDIDAATTDIVFGTQYVPFTQEFQYLGSRVTTNLKDVTDINNRLRQAKGQAAALGTFFQSTANTWSKLLIFLAIPVNTALYGAESWTLKVELGQ